MRRPTITARASATPRTRSMPCGSATDLARKRSSPPPQGAGLEQQFGRLIEVGRKLDEPIAPGGTTERVALIGEMLSIRKKSGELARLQPNRAQQQFERDAKRQNIVLKARQVGISTWIAARFFAATITHPGTVTVQVAHDLSAAQQIFRIVHRFLANLPSEWRTGALETSRANVRQLVFTHLDSEYRVETAADREAGRGLTITNLHCSEVARWPGDPAETLAGLRAAVAPHGEIVLESTPNGAGGCFYDEWQRAPEAGVARHFFPWWMEDAYVADATDLGALAEDEERLREEHHLSFEQVAFRRRLHVDFRGLAAQEYAEDPAACFLASGECVFDVAQLDQRMANAAAPLEKKDNGRLQVWYPPQSGREYIIGVDPAGGGVAGDYTCAQVVDRASGMQCAELRGHYSLAESARHVAALAGRFNGALIAVERNNHGHAVLMGLQRMEHCGNLYEHHDGVGWPTNAATRPQMTENFVALLTTVPELFASERLLNECRTFVRRKDGSPAAAPGAHDDCVMAMAIAQQVRALTAGWRRRN